MYRIICALSIFFIALFVVMGVAVLEENTICFDERCFSVELAVSHKERARGLMFRNRLGRDEGMLFLFEEEARHAFWMKNTLIALDIIWMDADKKIVFIKESAMPCHDGGCLSIAPTQKALYVLEVNAGSVKESGLRIGDRAHFSIP